MGEQEGEQDKFDRLFTGCKWVAVVGVASATDPLGNLKRDAYIDISPDAFAVGDLCGLALEGCYPATRVFELLRVKRVTPHTVTAVVLCVRRIATIITDADWLDNTAKEHVYSLPVPVSESGEQIVFRRTTRGMTNGGRRLLRVARIRPAHHCRANDEDRAQLAALPALDVRGLDGASLEIGPTAST